MRRTDICRIQISEDWTFIQIPFLPPQTLHIAMVLPKKERIIGELCALNLIGVLYINVIIGMSFT